MTDCDIPDATLAEVATFAVEHLPPGTMAWVERGHGGLPHRLFVRPVGLDADVAVGARPEGAPGPLCSCEFYDRLAPVRWLLAVVEHASIAVRGNLAYLEGCVLPAEQLDALAAERAHLFDMRRRAEVLMSERLRLERHGSALPRVPIPRNTISAETMRELGVSPMGEPARG